jgi:hypothetical protein
MGRGLLILVGIVSSLLCLGAGVFLIIGEASEQLGALPLGIGLYFIGKAFFVGPMLMSSATRSGSKTQAPVE